MGQQDPHPLVIGHRGAPGYRPEHSAASYRLAFELGADAVEPDIVATRDGVLVVRHENEISGTTDVASRAEFSDRRVTKTIDGVQLTGWFTEDFTWDELATLRCIERLPNIRPANREYDGAQPVLRLRDVLAIVDDESVKRGRSFTVVIEVKHARYFLDQGFDLAEMLVAELAATGWAERPERLIVESFELGVLDRLRSLKLQAPLVFLTERLGVPADEPQPGAPERSYAWYRSEPGLDLIAARVQGISVAKSDLFSLDASGQAVATNGLVSRGHERGLRVFTWTLRPENRYLNPRYQVPADAVAGVDGGAGTDAGAGADAGAGIDGGVVLDSDWGDWQGEYGLLLASGVDAIFVDHPDLGVTARESFLSSAQERAEAETEVQSAAR